MTKVIAEIGINHNGSLKRLFKLIDIAKIAGADYVKMQTYKPENVILKNIGFAPYQLMLVLVNVDICFIIVV